MILGACGLDCEKCSARIATLNNDNALREETAKEWSIEYNFPCTPEMINCTGCMEEGVKVGHCNDCETRKCVTEKKIDNCKACDVFPCENQKNFMEAVHEIKTNFGL